MNCHHYSENRCHSCSWIGLDYPWQVKQKETHLRQQLEQFYTSIISKNIPSLSPTLTSSQSSFRNKAKMVALGAAHQATLGIINHQGDQVSLTDCLLYTPKMQQLLHYLETWIQKAGIPPYNVQKRKGELKFIIVHENLEGKFLIRLVVRSLLRLHRIREHIPLIQAAFPSVEVISLNLQPEHQAILEGPEEIYLTEQEFLTETLNGVPLCIQPGCFFQTNSTTAEKLYHMAAIWVQSQLQAMKDSLQAPMITDDINIVDLFCGVGGFGITMSHLLQQSQSYQVSLTGIEISPYAQARAKWTSEQIGFTSLQFHTLDLTQSFIDKRPLEDQPDVLIVNPPRRGIGSQVCQWIEAKAPRLIIYSSCQSESMMTDINQLPSYQISKIQIFDLFPHSTHYETLCLLTHQEVLSRLV
jgi:23S rRNA (uracil747-C5)-methyltransferase